MEKLESVRKDMIEALAEALEMRDVWADPDQELTIRVLMRLVKTHFGKEGLKEAHASFEERRVRLLGK